MGFDERFGLLTDRLGDAPDSDDPALVLAMPIVVRIEKRDPPGRQATLVAAARAAVLLCLDEQADADGPWGDAVAAWCGARIRKISRRARGAHWTAAQDVPGVTVAEGDGFARAIVPGPVGDVDRRIDRLQIGGTELEGPLEPPGVVGEAPVVLWVNPGLDMTLGKLAAQVGHGSMLAARLFDVSDARRWWEDGCPLAVAEPSEEQWADLLARDGSDTVAVRDAGFTEVAPGSVTVIAERRRETDTPGREDGR
ncbi:aminoacyl-tRNA hydrolase [Williamsia deligens]|uniref:peptidyl-tRNA hydrolase n=1 Tax=Williamsia deligens TaxID=321325 RepID=A0ABW3G1X1_9NOCA|nr:aminoacyl-tRNA hydrolase [Williamsia deligens]MCP2195013.1 Peptidyl-tRNA hydrolase [Williamsia deligens]